MSARTLDISFDLQGIQAAATTFWEQFGSPARVFAFHGPMGAGKTSFILSLCHHLHILDTGGSPTFPIINEYRYPGGKIFHIDLYRLRDEEEALRAGVEEALYSGAICLVEWPERAPGIFPPGTVQVHLEILDPLTRKITAIDPSAPPENHRLGFNIKL